VSEVKNKKRDHTTDHRVLKREGRTRIEGTTKYNNSKRKEKK